MAKYREPSHPKFRCRVCDNEHVVTSELVQPDPWQDANTPRIERYFITRRCACEEAINLKPLNIQFTQAKETKVAKQFDTTEAKNLALNSIVSKAEAVERAQFNRIEAVAKVEALHAQHIADAAIALDRVLMDALQSGVAMEDIDLFLPEYAGSVEQRVTDLLDRTSLANVTEGV